MSKGQEKAKVATKPARKAYRDYTPEEKAAYKAKREEAAKRKDAVVKTLVDFVKELEPNGIVILPDNIKTAIANLNRMPTEKRASTGPKFDFVAAHFADVDYIQEDDLYKRCKVGRTDMKALVKKHLKMAKPEDRLWVQLNLDNGQFEVLAKGADMPEGWRGFIPADQAAPKEDGQPDLGM